MLKNSKKNINHLITNVKYSIDLHHCEEFEIAIEDIFKYNLKNRLIG